MMGHKSPEGAVVRSLFGSPPNAAESTPKFRRILALGWEAVMLLLKRRPADFASNASPKLIIFFSAQREDSERLVEKLNYPEFQNRVLISKRPGRWECPNEISILGRMFGGALMASWWGVSLPFLLFFRNVSSQERIVEVARTILIAHCVGRIRPRRVFYLGGYTRYSNLAAFLIDKKTGAIVTRSCSPNPLVECYSDCVCGEFILTTPLQVPEYHRLKANWFVDRVLLRPGFELPELSKAAYRVAPSGNRTIGFLSSGLWRRFGSGNFGDKEQVDAEERAVVALGEYLKTQPDVNLVVYPHPREEKADEEVFKLTSKHYHEILGSDRVTVLGVGSKTQEHFTDSNLLVSVWSTSAMEALFCGHKLLIMHLNYEPKYKVGRGWRHCWFAGLEGITVNSVEGLASRLEIALTMSRQDYFDVHKLGFLRNDAGSSEEIEIESARQ